MEEWSVWFSPRLSLGLGNPNSAGALLAMALVSALPFCFGANWRRAGGLILAALLGCGIAMTASRGALAALAASLLVLGWRGTTERADRWMLGLAALIVAGVFWASPAGKRVRLPQEDVSLTSRSTMFARVPAMVAAAPGGWGVGRSAEAYQNWFQPVGDLKMFKHVLSTHAIWLVERGWVAGLLYLAGWALAFLWCAMPGPPWMAGGTACWAVFAVAAMFSHVGERFWLWLPLLGWLFAATLVRCREGNFPTVKDCGRAFACVAMILAGIILMGRPWEGVRLRNGLVEFGAWNRGASAGQRISVVAGGAREGGIGQVARAEVPPGKIVEYPWERGTALRGEFFLMVGADPGFRVVPGTFVRKVVWFAPEGVLPWKLPLEFRRAPIVAISGEFSTTVVAPWRKYFADGGKGELKILPGTGDYLPDPWNLFWAEVKSLP